MDPENKIQVGKTREEKFQVAQEHAAIHVGSGGFYVLATPALIAFMERVAYQLLGESLPDGESSVGILVSIRHLAPTPVGATVRVQAEIISVTNSQVTFSVKAWDQAEMIAEGSHQRVVINAARFQRRVDGKK